MSADKYGHGIPDEVIEDLARTILPSIRKYFESEEGQREFAEWKEQQENSRIGSYQKTVTSSQGKPEGEVPRDRKGRIRATDSQGEPDGHL